MIELVYKHNEQLMYIREEVGKLKEGSHIELEKNDKVVLTYIDIKNFLIELSQQSNRYIVIDNEKSFTIIRLTDYSNLNHFYKLITKKDMEEPDNKFHIIKIIKRYMAADYEQVKSYGVKEHIKEQDLCPYTYIYKAACGLNAFKNYPEGSNVIIRTILTDLVKEKYLELVYLENDGHQYYKFRQTKSAG